MAYYNANEIIKLTRTAMGITQEELCDGICDVTTLSRIENGHQCMRRETYRSLMRKMGRVAEMRYTVCLEQDGILLEDRINLEKAFKKFDYAEAERYLQNMKKIADDNILTRQYIARAESLVAFYSGGIQAEELIEKLDEVIRMTVADYEKYLMANNVFPFVKEELLTLMSLGNAYCKLGEKERGMQIYESIIKCLEKNYMGEPEKTTMLITVKNNIVKIYSAEGRHLEALDEIESCLKLCRKWDYSHLVAPLFVSKAHNYVRMVEKGLWAEQYLDDAKKILRQAYCLATARKEREITSTIVRYYEQHLGAWS